MWLRVYNKEYCRVLGNRQETLENYIMWKFKICTLYQILLG